MEFKKKSYINHELSALFNKCFISVIDYRCQLLGNSDIKSGNYIKNKVFLKTIFQ